MAIFPIQFPPIGLAEETLRIQNKQSYQTSSFNGKQTVVPNYSAWSLDFSFNRMTLAQAQVVASWQDQLQGSFGTFTYQPFTGVGYNPHTITITQGMYALSNVAVLSGFVGSAPPGIVVGNYIQIGTQLLRLAAVPLLAASNGTLEIEFYPAFRADYPVGTAVNINSPKGVFRLTSSSSSDDNASGSGYQIDQALIPEFTPLSAVEAI